MSEDFGRKWTKYNRATVTIGEGEDAITLRNLEAQVQKNKDDIEALDLETLSGLPERMDDAEADIENLIDEVETLDGAVETLEEGKQKEIFTHTVTLETGLWVGNLQTVSIAGLRETDLLVVSPTNGPTCSYELYTQNAVRGYSQATNTLTFQCGTVPEQNVDVIVMVIRPN